MFLRAAGLSLDVTTTKLNVYLLELLLLLGVYLLSVSTPVNPTLGFYKFAKNHSLLPFPLLHAGSSYSTSNLPNR